mgnify:CR=1 FL=1
MCIVGELWHSLGGKDFGLFCTLFAVFFGSLKCWKISENKGIPILLGKMSEGNETVGKMKLCGKWDCG